jgi:hypothetical protein
VETVSFVAPVSGRARFGDTVHGRRSDLDFAAVAPIVDDRRMQGAVPVQLGVRDIVVGVLGQGRIEALENGECLVTGLHVGHDDSQGSDVVDLVQGQPSADHLAVDGDDAFAAAVDAGPDALPGQPSMEDDGEADHAPAVEGAIVERLPDLAVAAGVTEEEGDVFEEAEGAPEGDAVDGRGRLGGEAKEPADGGGFQEIYPIGCSSVHQDSAAISRGRTVDHLGPERGAHSIPDYSPDPSSADITRHRNLLK